MADRDHRHRLDSRCVCLHRRTVSAGLRAYCARAPVPWRRVESMSGNGRCAPVGLRHSLRDGMSGVIWYSEYDLQPRRALSALAAPGPRRGALIRIGGGFADIHPWPELGDAPLDAQIATLARGQTTPLTRRSLEMAALDAQARDRGVSLFEGVSIPESHWPGDDPPPGFDTVKLKSIERLPSNVRLRIDFNATL